MSANLPPLGTLVAKDVTLPLQTVALLVTDLGRVVSTAARFKRPRNLERGTSWYPMVELAGATITMLSTGLEEAIAHEGPFETHGYVETFTPYVVVRATVLRDALALLTWGTERYLDDWLRAHESSRGEDREMLLDTLNLLRDTYSYEVANLSGPPS